MQEVGKAATYLLLSLLKSGSTPEICSREATNCAHSSKRNYQGLTQEQGNRELEVVEWFAAQSQIAMEKFLPYLDFSKP